MVGKRVAKMDEWMNGWNRGYLITGSPISVKMVHYREQARGGCDGMYKG